jgi:hypothetical protein
MSPLQRGDLHYVTGQLATVAVVSVWQVPVVGIAVGDLDAIVVWLGAWSFWHGWRPVLAEYPDPCAAWHWWHTMGRRILFLEFLIGLAVLLLCLTWKHSPTILCRNLVICLNVNDTEGIPAGRRKPYDFYNTCIIPRPEDDPLTGSKRVVWLKYTNRNSLFNIVVFDEYSSSCLIHT